MWCNVVVEECVETDCNGRDCGRDKSKCRYNVDKLPKELEDKCPKHGNPSGTGWEDLGLDSETQNSEHINISERTIAFGKEPPFEGENASGGSATTRASSGEKRLRHISDIGARQG
jgi:hypothetical protein